MNNLNRVGKKIIIRAILGVSILTFSFLAWWNLSGALNAGPDWLQKSLWSLAAFLFLGVATGLAYLMEDRKILFYGLPLLIILPALFFLKESWLSGIFAIAFLFFILAAWRADFEKSLRIKFVSWVILKKSLGPALTALALVTTVFFLLCAIYPVLGAESFYSAAAV